MDGDKQVEPKVSGEQGQREKNGGSQKLQLGAQILFLQSSY